MSEQPLNTSRSPFSRLCDRAVRLLAVRDHSEQELRRKLLTPAFSAASGKPQDDVTYSAEEVEQVIAWCYEQSWLNDLQFASRFISSRSRKGYGPQAIRQSLQQKGIDRETQHEAFGACDIDWSRLALETAERKFGTPLPAAWEKRVKVQRFLLYRGFFMEDIKNIY